jgi:hypothetical protein
MPEDQRVSFQDSPPGTNSTVASPPCRPGESQKPGRRILIQEVRRPGPSQETPGHPVPLHPAGAIAIDTTDYQTIEFYGVTKNGSVFPQVAQGQHPKGKTPGSKL